MSKKATAFPATPELAAKREALKALIAECGSSFFTVTFFKKGSFNKGKLESRVMNCSTTGNKYTKGCASTLEGLEDVVGCFDLPAAKKLPEEERGHAFRAIWLDGVSEFKAAGKTVTFEDYPASPLFAGATLT